METNKKKLIKYALLNHIKTYLRYYVPKENIKKEEDKLFAALKDLFDNVPLEQMGDTQKFCGNGRWNFLFRKTRKTWGETMLDDIHEIIVSRL